MSLFLSLIRFFMGECSGFIIEGVYNLTYLPSGSALSFFLTCVIQLCHLGKHIDLAVMR